MEAELVVVGPPLLEGDDCSGGPRPPGWLWSGWSGCASSSSFLADRLARAQALCLTARRGGPLTCRPKWTSRPPSSLPSRPSCGRSLPCSASSFCAGRSARSSSASHRSSTRTWRSPLLRRSILGDSQKRRSTISPSSLLTSYRSRADRSHRIGAHPWTTLDESVVATLRGVTFY